MFFSDSGIKNEGSKSELFNLLNKHNWLPFYKCNGKIIELDLDALHKLDVKKYFPTLSVGRQQEMQQFLASNEAEGYVRKFISNLAEQAQPSIFPRV